MEADPVKQRSRQKRRERALQLQQEKQTREEDEASGQDDHESPPRSSKDKLPRSKHKKGKNALFEEDVIDGFAILSFKTLEELEVISNKNGCIKNKSRPEEDTNNKDANTKDTNAKDTNAKDTNVKDINSQDKDDTDKIKKKKIKKNGSLNHCVSNCNDIKENVNDSSTNIAPSNNNNNNSNDLSINSEISGSSTSSSRVSIASNDSSNDNHHRHDHRLHHNQHSKNGTLEPPRSVSRDGLSDASTRSGSGQGYVCDVESGDDKVSESGSDLYSGIPVGVAILNDLCSKSHINPLTSPLPLTPPAAPPGTALTPLCNGVVGSTNLPVTSVPPVLAATTTTTTTTTTTATSRPGFSNSLTKSTTVTPATVLPTQSVIQPTSYFSEHHGSKLAQFSPGSILSQSHNIRTLSPHSQQHQHDSVSSANSTCARSLQYSKPHKTYSHSNAKGNSPCHSPIIVDKSSSTDPHQSNTLECVTENLPPPHLQLVSNSLNHPTPNLLQHHQSGHFALHGHHPSETSYPYPQHVRTEPFVNHHTNPHVNSEYRIDQQCNIGSTPQQLVSHSGVYTPTTATSSILISNPHNSHHQHHSSSISSNHHRSSSSSSRKSNTYSHNHIHQHGSNNRPTSPLGHTPKRSCRTSPSVLPQSTSSSSSLPSTNISSLNDISKAVATPKPLTCKPDHLSHSNSGSGKDLTDCKSKVNIGGQVHHPSSNHNHHQHKYNRDRDKEREERDKQKTPVSLSISLAPTLFPNPKPSWSTTPGPLYSHLLQLHHPSPLTPSSVLHSLGSHHSPSSVASHSSPLFTLPLALPPPLLAAGTPTLSAGMFASPIHATPPSLTSAPPLPTHQAASSQFSTENLIRSQDFLHQDLNNRLLAHRDSSAIGLSPFVRNETHQHQHQHLHNHMHQHTYGGLSASALVPPARPLFEKIPKSFDAGVFRPSIVPNYSAAFSSLLPPGPSGASLTSSLQGAFQPKSLMTPGQMLVPFRDREKAVPPPGLPPPQKKQGRWCAVHVRVAWEIYHRQQKKLPRDQDGDTGSSSSSTTSSKSGHDIKPSESMLRPSGNHLPGGGSTTPRPSESSLLASVARSLPDGLPHPGSNFLSSTAHLGMTPFQRPSPYPLPSLLNPLGFSGLGGSMFSSVRDMVPPGLPSGLHSPHEWNRLHRTPSSFPSWPKSEAEKEREREMRKEEERERERRGGSFNHQLSGLEETRHKDLDPSRPKSRSRSRSPLRNGRVDHHSKSELGSYDRRYEDKRALSSSSSSLKLKEERRDDDIPSLSHHLAEREKIERERMERERERLEKDRFERDRMERERIEKEKMLQNAAVVEREKLLQAMEQREKFLQTSGYLGLSPFCAGLPTHPGLFDRRMGLMVPSGSGYPFLERPPVPTSMWSPFDKSAAEIAHRLEVEREQERMAMMSRLSSIPSHLAALEQERLKEQILREQQEREYDLRRQYLDRLPAFTADRLRAVDPLTLGSYFPRTVSPMFGPCGLTSLKSNSPHGIPGAPPPLIPSSSSAVASTMLSSRSHNNSPSSSSKSKGCSPADSTSDLKDKREGSSTDPDAHSR